jgi:hypothetical protein
MSTAASVPGQAQESCLRRLVEAAAGAVEPFEPGRRLTTLGSWFTARSETALVVAVAPGRNREEVATAVAYAVAWRRDRDLVLLVPEDAVGPTVVRASHLEGPVEVWAIGQTDLPRRVRIPSTAEVIQETRARPLRREPPHDLGERSSWVADLVRLADAHWALEAAHRGSYRAWHCEGRQVLKLVRQGGGLLVQAGVQYGRPPSDRPPFSEVLTEPPTTVQRARVEAAVATAVQDRLDGRDAGHLEHRLQAALGAARLAGLAMAEFAREYPAWRGDGAPGYVDFLGLGRDGRLHVVETKIGSDPMLVFQAIDYAIWVRAHAAAIRTDLGWPAGDDDTVHIDLVVAPDRSKRKPKPALGPYTAGQLAALPPDVPWQVHVVEDAGARVPTIVSHPPRTLPPVAPGVVVVPIDCT